MTTHSHAQAVVQIHHGRVLQETVDGYRAMLLMRDGPMILDCLLEEWRIMDRTLFKRPAPAVPERPGDYSYHVSCGNTGLFFTIFRQGLLFEAIPATQALDVLDRLKRSA